MRDSKSFMHGAGSFNAATSLSSLQSQITIYKEDFAQFSNLVNQELDNLLRKNIITNRNQILFYKSSHGLLSEPSAAAITIEDAIDENFVEDFLLGQFHYGINFLAKEKERIMTFNFKNLSRHLLHVRGTKLNRCRTYQFFNTGSFFVDCDFKNKTNINYPGMISYVQGYHPAIHMIKKTRLTFTLAFFILIGKAHAATYPTLKKLKYAVNNLLESYTNFIDCIKNSRNRLRFECVHNIFKWSDLKDHASSMSMDDPLFLVPLLECLFENQIINISTEKAFWTRHVSETGEMYLQIVKDICNAPQMDPPIIHDRTLLLKLTCAEIMLKYFVNGSSKNLPYKAVKFCLVNNTELTSKNEKDIVCFKNIDELIANEMNQFLTEVRPILAERNFLPSLLHLKAYIQVILEETSSTHLVYATATADDIFGQNERYHFLIEQEGRARVEKLSQTVILLFMILGTFCRKYYGIPSSDARRNVDVRNMFKKNSLEYIARTRENVRFTIGGMIEPKYVERSIKRPKTIFGQILLSSIVTSNDAKAASFSILLSCFIQNYVEVFPSSYIHGDGSKPDKSAQYNWLQIVNNTRAVYSTNTASTQTVEDTNEIEEPKIFTYSELTKILDNVTAIANAVVAKKTIPAWKMIHETQSREGENQMSAGPANGTSSSSIERMVVEPEIVSLSDDEEDAIEDQNIVAQQRPTLTSILKPITSKPKSVKRRSSDKNVSFSKETKARKIDEALESSASFLRSWATSSNTATTENVSVPPVPQRISQLQVSLPLRKLFPRSFEYEDIHCRAIAEHGHANVKRSRGNAVWRELAKSPLFEYTGKTEVALRKKFYRMIESDMLRLYLDEAKVAEVLNVYTQKDADNTAYHKESSTESKTSTSKKRLTNNEDETNEIRRSARTSQKAVRDEKKQLIEHLLKTEVEEGLQVKNFEFKGRGVVATKPFVKGAYVVEYSGELIDQNEARKRELIYSQDPNIGCYMFYFKYKDQQYCVDATADNGKLGRLVNHSRKGNLIPRIYELEKKPRLVLMAKNDIKEGEEITFNYGDTSKTSLQHHPWLAS